MITNGVGRAAYNQMVKAIFNGDVTVNESIAAVIKGLDELEAFYELKGEKLPWLGKVRERLHKAYNFIHNIHYR